MTSLFSALQKEKEGFRRQEESWILGGCPLPSALPSVPTYQVKYSPTSCDSGFRFSRGQFSTPSPRVKKTFRLDKSISHSKSSPGQKPCHSFPFLSRGLTGSDGRETCVNATRDFVKFLKVNMKVGPLILPPSLVDNINISFCACTSSSQRSKL